MSTSFNAGGWALVNTFRGLDMDVQEYFKSLSSRDIDDDYTRCSWPCSRIGYQMAGDLASFVPVISGHWFESDLTWTGNPGYRTLTGVTRNSVGVALGGCTVSLYNSATGALYMTTTSDSAGNFTLYHPDTQNCFIVAQNAAGDVEGCTINTLVGV